MVPFYFPCWVIAVTLIIVWCNAIHELWQSIWLILNHKVNSTWKSQTSYSCVALHEKGGGGGGNSPTWPICRHHHALYNPWNSLRDSFERSTWRSDYIVSYKVITIFEELEISLEYHWKIIVAFHRGMCYSK